MPYRQTDASPGDYLVAYPQYLLPGHLISRFTLWVTRRRSSWFKNALMKWFIKRFNVNMSEALQEDYHAYGSFNEFFTRQLKPEARPLAQGDDVCLCPVDGAVSQAGEIKDGTIYQAKRHDYSALALLGGYADVADNFQAGKFSTLYLSPRDYHRIHMPVAGQLTEMIYVPGRLFSVNPQTTRCIPGLFARNERVIALFDTDLGRMAMVLVGAINVGCIETVWHGVVTPPHKQPVHRWIYAGRENIQLAQGEEMGRFNMGSTVVCLFDNRDMEFASDIRPYAGIKMGQPLLHVKA